MQNLKVIDFQENLQEAYLVKREKRFFVEFLWKQADTVDNTQKLVAHTNNTGSMLGLLGKGRRILLSKASNPNRKLAWTLEAVHADYSLQEYNALHKHTTIQASQSKQDISLAHAQENWIGVNTSIPNKFLHNLFLLQRKFPEKDILPWAKEYTHIRMEATSGDSRLDALLYREEENTPEKENINLKKMDTKNKTENNKTAFNKLAGNKLADNKAEKIRVQALEHAHASKKTVKPIKKKLSEIHVDTMPSLWVECKSVTLVEEEMAAFPDAISERGTKHLETLMRILEENRESKKDASQTSNLESKENTKKYIKNTSEKKRAAMLYIIQRTDGTCFSPADYIDKKYSEKLLEAYKAGVEVYAIIANIQKDGVYYGGTLPLAPCFFV